MAGKENQRRGKQFELKVVSLINRLTYATGIEAEHLKRYDYGLSQPDIKLNADFKLDINYLDCKYTVKHFSCKEKSILVTDVVEKYDLCDIVLGQRFGKQKINTDNISVLRPLFDSKLKTLFYIEMPLDYYLLHIASKE